MVQSFFSLGYQSSDILNAAATPAQASFAVHDPDRQFYALDTGGGEPPYRDTLIGTRIRLDWVTDSGSFLLYAGWIKSVVPDLREYSGMTTIIATDLLSELRATDYIPDFNTDLYAHEELRNMFESGELVPFPYGGTSGRGGWGLGTGALGSTAAYYEPLGFILEETAIQLPWVGDAADRGQGVNAGGYIQDLILPEISGRFFTNRDGEFVFHSQGHDRGERVRQVIDGTWLTDYRYGHAPVYNRITVNYYPRRVEAAGSVIWTSDRAPNVIRLEKGDSQTFRARYETDEDDAVIAAKDVIDPEADVDYRTRDPRDSEQLEVTVDAGASTAEVTVRYIDNPRGGAARLTFLQLRGTPVISSDYEQIVKRSNVSIALHGSREIAPIHLRFVSQYDRADQYARFMLNRYGTQIGRFEMLEHTFGWDDLRGNALDYLRLTVGGSHIHQHRPSQRPR